MSVEHKYLDLEEKLDKMCSENHLEFSFKRDDFPIIAHFEPIWEQAAQMRIEGIEDGSPIKPSDPDASFDMIFGDELIIQTSKDFTIDDEVMNKLKNAAKKLHYYFLQLWFKRSYEQSQRDAEVKTNPDAFTCYSGDSEDEDDIKEIDGGNLFLIAGGNE